MSKLHILIFTPRKVFTVLQNGKEFVYKEYSIWSLDNLERIIASFVNTNKSSSLGILLNNEFCFTFNDSVDATLKGDLLKTHLSRLIADRIPMDLDELTWDYKLTKTAQGNVAQIVAVNKIFINKLFDICNKNKVKIAYVEPVSYLLSKVKIEGKYFTGLYTSEYENLGYVSHDGVMLFNQNIDTMDIRASVESFINIIRVKFPQALPMPIIIDDNKKLIDNDLMDYISQAGFKKQINDLDPLLAHIPEDTKLRDQALRLDLTDSKPRKESAFGKFFKRKEKVSDLPRKSYRSLILSIVLIGLMIFAGVYVYRYYVNNFVRTPVPANSTQTNVAPENEDKAVDTPKENIQITESDLNESVENSGVTINRDVRIMSLENYSVEIQNGSGEAGEAEKLKVIIDELNPKSVAVGNADKYDYLDTIITFKSEEFFRTMELIETKMNQYEIEFSDEVLDEDYPYDIRIIIGKNRKIVPN